MDEVSPRSRRSGSRAVAPAGPAGRHRGERLRAVGAAVVVVVLTALVVVALGLLADVATAERASASGPAGAGRVTAERASASDSS